MMNHQQKSKCSFFILHKTGGNYVYEETKFKWQLANDRSRL